MNRKRYELSFDPQDDADYIALIEEYRSQGIAVMDVIRMAIRALVSGPSETPVDDLKASPLMAELLDRLAAMQDRQTEIEALNAMLVNRLAGIEIELSRLQAGGAVIEDAPVFGDPDDERQRELSAKLKAQKFTELMQ
jgi:hypothetical protein